MDEKAKQGIGIGIGIIGISVFGVFGYWYYKKLKKQQKIDRLLEEGEADIEENYNRGRFYVFSNVSDRFKVLETVGEEGVAVRGTKRLRVSGNIHRTDSPSGYNINNRNVSLSDLEIPINISRKRNLIYPE